VANCLLWQLSIPAASPFLMRLFTERARRHSLEVRTFLKVYMELGSYFLFLQEQIKDIIIIAFSASAMV